ncbi:MAG TPA: DUF5058 family protein, partial [Negativicutes bacterium]|nr:DUF5058 family protein [Negativicutes bacterium]
GYYCNKMNNGGEKMDFQTTINSSGMWIASSIMVIMVILQSVVFLRAGLNEANRIGLSRQRCIRAMRASVLTSVGPSLAPVIVLMALIPVLGAPTTWMRLCDVGAPSTELAISAMAAKVIGVDMRSAAYDLKAYSYSMWGMALNNLGFLAMVFLFNHKMGQGLETFNKRSNPVLVKFVMSGALLGLISYLVTAQVLAGGQIKSESLIVAIVSGIAMYFLNFVGRRYPWIREPSLGIAMIVAMSVTVLF